MADEGLDVRTKSLITEAIPSNLHEIPVYRPTHITSEVPDGELGACGDARNCRVVLASFSTGASRSRARG
jgi:hypothetical protein